MRVSVCDYQVPFVTGGAEALDTALVRRLEDAGHVADLVTLPFAWTPRLQILQSALAWRLVSLDGAEGPPDLVVAGRFPSYLVRHPNKVTWLIHQHRPAYELCGTPYSDFTHDDHDVGVRETLLTLDRRMLVESQRIFSDSRNVASRLRKFCGLQATTLYHPPPLAGRLTAGPLGDYVE